MSELPIDLPVALADRLRAALDVEGKIARALNDVGHLADRDVAVIGTAELVTRPLADLGARVVSIDWASAPDRAEAESADAILSLWDRFWGVDPAEIAEADRILRPGGRLLVVHDYGRDDVSRLLGDRPQYGSWGRVNGPFLRSGFRIRVVHCWWTFESLDAARDFVTTAFDGAGEEVAAGLRRPRLSYNIAIYHRLRGVNAAA